MKRLFDNNEIKAIRVVQKRRGQRSENEGQQGVWPQAVKWMEMMLTEILFRITK